MNIFHTKFLFPLGFIFLLVSFPLSSALGQVMFGSPGASAGGNLANPSDEDTKVVISNDIVKPQDFIKTVKEEHEKDLNAMITKINAEQAEDDQTISASAASSGGGSTTSTNPNAGGNIQSAPPPQSPPSQPSTSISNPPPQQTPPPPSNNENNPNQGGGWNINY